MKILYLISLLAATLFSQPVFAGTSNYNIYTPESYKHVNIVQAPRNATVQGEAIELVVDFSGSMTPWIGTSIDTLQYILPKIPKSTAVALRVFGGYSPGISYTDSCKATHLAAYFKKDNQEEILKGLAQTRLGGSTPLEFALRETVEKDFNNLKVINSKPGTYKKIILVTDGGECCGGDPCAYIRSVMQRRKDIKIDVIQLGSDASLMCLTSSTGGTYYKMNTHNMRRSFVNALERAFNVPEGTVEKAKAEEQSKTVNPPDPSQPKLPQPPQQPQQPIQKKKPGYKFINL